MSKLSFFSIFMLVVFSWALESCDSSLSKNKNSKENKINKLKDQNTSKEKDSLLFIKTFQIIGNTLNSKEKNKIERYVNFPFYGTAPFTGVYSNKERGIDQVTFKKEIDKIFSKIPIKILSDKEFNQFSLYNEQDFARTFSESSVVSEKIWSDLDKGSYIGECYIQYDLNDGRETNLSYLFGRIKGEYKLVAMTYRGVL